MIHPGSLALWIKQLCRGMLSLPGFVSDLIMQWPFAPLNDSSLGCRFSNQSFLSPVQSSLLTGAFVSSHCHARMIIYVATMFSELQHRSVDEHHWNYCYPREQQVFFSSLGHLYIYCVLHRTMSPLVVCGSSPCTAVLIMVWLVSSSSIHVIYSPPLAHRIQPWKFA